MTTEPRQRSVAFNYGISIVLGLGGFLLGFHMGIFNPLSRPLFCGVYKFDPQADEEIISFYEGMVNMLFCLGAMIGVLANGVLADKFGRRTMLYIGEIAAILLVAVYWPVNINFLMTARILTGIVAGITMSSYSITMAELLPDSIIGFGNAFTYAILSFANLLGYLTGNFFDFDGMVAHWRILLLWPVVISVIRLALFPVFIKTETPKYLFNAVTGRDEMKIKITEAYSYIYHETELKHLTEKEIAMFEESQAEGKVTVGSLFTPKYRMRFFSGCALAFSQQFCGINFLCFYSNKLFDTIGGMGKQVTLAIGIAILVGSIISVILISRNGRKSDIVMGLLFQAIGMFGVYYGYLIQSISLLIPSVCLYVAAFAIGLGGTETAYIGVIIPPIGVGIALAIHWTMAALISQLTPILVIKFSPDKLILFFAIVCVLLFFGLDYMLIETKGKDEEEIAREFRTRRYHFLDFIFVPKREIEDLDASLTTTEKQPYSQAETASTAKNPNTIFN